MLGMGPWWILGVTVEAKGTEAESFSLLNNFMCFAGGG